MCNVLLAKKKKMCNVPFNYQVTLYKLYRENIKDVI